MEYTLNVVAERSVVRESLKGIIWSIFFHRLFGPITPDDNHFLEVPYPVATDLPDIDTLIDDKIDQLIKSHFDSIIQTPDAPVNQSHNDLESQTGQVMIQFFDRKTTKSKKKSSWFGQGKSEDSDNLRLWESWIIHVKCLPIADQATGGAVNTQDHDISMSKESFEDNLNKIIDIVDTHKEHIPPITSLESSPFPYTIEVDRNNPTYDSSGNESWGNYIKKILD